MATPNSFGRIVMLAILVCLTFSCSHQKSSISQCPDFRSGTKEQKPRFTKSKRNKSALRSVARKKKDKESNGFVNLERTQRKSLKELKTAIRSASLKDLNLSELQNASSTLIQPQEERIPAQDLQPDECDVIYTYNRKEIRCLVKEMNNSEVFYVPCDNPEGPMISLERKEIKSIKYSDGRIKIVDDNFGSESELKSDGDKSVGSSKYSPDNDALISLLSGILGFFFTIAPAVFSIPFVGILGLVGFIMAVVFGRRAKREEKYVTKPGSRTMATIGRILGYIGLGLNILAVFLAILFIVVLLNG